MTCTDLPFYNNVAHLLEIEQDPDSSIRKEMWIRPINPSTYGAKNILMTFKFKGKGITVTDDVGGLVPLAVDGVLPVDYTYTQHEINVNFFNRAVTGSATARRGVNIRLRFASAGTSALANTVRGHVSAGSVTTPSMMASTILMADTVLPNGLSPPN